MPRSRADEILEGWKMVVHSASKPSEAPRPNAVRSALPLTLAGSAVAVGVLVVGLAVRGMGGPGPGSTPFAGAESTASPSAAVIAPTLPATPTIGPASPVPSAQPSAVPPVTPPPSIAGGPSAPPAGDAVTVAKDALDRYEAALARGDYAAAWAMLPVDARQGLSFSDYAKERQAFFASAGDQFTLLVPPLGGQPDTFWLGQLTEAQRASLDMSRTVAIEVDFPKLAGNNAGYEIWVVGPGQNGAMHLYQVR